MIKDYKNDYYLESELQELKELEKEYLETGDQVEKLEDDESRLDFISQELLSKPLELGEDETERENRLHALSDQFNSIEKEKSQLIKRHRSLGDQINSIHLKARSRYIEQREDSGILQDCLSMIKAIEPDDVLNYHLFQFRGTEQYTETSDFIKFSYRIFDDVIEWYLDYFRQANKPREVFEIMSGLYDQTLKFYPDGLSDQARQSPFCIFDDKFFEALKDSQDTQARREYEYNLFSYKDEIDSHILPTGVKITATQKALGIVGTESRQISIDEFLESQKVNNLVTFKGLDDSPNGMQIVFNENQANNDNIVVTFKNLETACGGGTAPSKVFAMVLEKMNTLGYFRYKNIDTAVTISVKELIQNGDYANWRSANRGLTQAKKTLSELLVNFSNKKKGTNLDVPWFSTIGWKDKGTLLISPNKDIDWRMVGSHFAIYPVYLYKLKTHAYRLAFYLFTQARINKPTNKDGDIVFSLSLRTVSQELGLPDVSSIKKDYKKLILDKIISAIREIENADQEYYQDRSMLSLKIESDKELSAKEIIETASLKVTFKKGHITESYQKLIDSKHDIIESNKRKKATQKKKKATQKKKETSS